MAQKGQARTFFSFLPTIQLIFEIFLRSRIRIQRRQRRNGLYIEILEHDGIARFHCFEAEAGCLMAPTTAFLTVSYIRGGLSELYPCLLSFAIS